MDRSPDHHISGRKPGIERWQVVHAKITGGSHSRLASRSLHLAPFASYRLPRKQSQLKKQRAEDHHASSAPPSIRAA